MEGGVVLVLLNQREPPVSALLTAREELRIQREGRLGAMALGAGEGAEPVPGKGLLPGYGTSWDQQGAGRKPLIFSLNCLFSPTLWAVPSSP